MIYGKEFVLCLKDNFENKTSKSPKFGEIYEVEVDMNALLQLVGFKDLYPQENFADITDQFNELTDILLENNINPIR